MTAFFGDVAAALGGVLAEAGAWLLLGFGVAGVLHAFVSKAWLGRHLGRRGLASVLKGTAVGVPLPLCSCAVIPAAASLRRGGASKGASASFAVATPEIDVPAFSLTWALLGPVMAVARVMGAAVSAVVAGLLVDAVDRDPPASHRADGVRAVSLGLAQESSAAAPADSCCQHHSQGAQDHQKRVGVLGRLLEAARYGYVDLPADLAKWLVLGFVASALVEVVLPPAILAGPVGSGPLGIAAAMGLGLVIYVCATGSTPLAAALVAKGLGPGAALAFLLAGPATNPATMAWVYKDLGRRALVVYVLAIGVVAFLAGLALQWLAAGAWSPEPAPLGQGETSSSLGGAALAAVLTYAIVKPAFDRLLAGSGAGRQAEGASCCHTDDGVPERV
ncbi:MAG: SO_0444 family Cu/Zn efflux transporter [Phycisphaerales bacterium]